jgi:hypothetical protein
MRAFPKQFQAGQIIDIRPSDDAFRRIHGSGI